MIAFMDDNRGGHGVVDLQRPADRPFNLSQTCCRAPGLIRLSACNMHVLVSQIAHYDTKRAFIPFKRFNFKWVC